jgi:ElaB/YqjD/DUF883 family membrane-anchored ribosome-binding protein
MKRVRETKRGLICVNAPGGSGIYDGFASSSSIESHTMNDIARDSSAPTASAFLRGTNQKLLQYSRRLRRGLSPGKLGDALFDARIRIDGLQGKAREAARSADDAVHHHPYGAIGMAALAGLLLGLLATRR